MIILGFQGGVTGVVFIDGAQSSRLILLQEGRRGARANIESDIDNTLQGGGHRPAFRVSKVFFISFFIFLIEDQQQLKKREKSTMYLRKEIIWRNRNETIYFYSHQMHI